MSSMPMCLLPSDIAGHVDLYVYFRSRKPFVPVQRLNLWAQTIISGRLVPVEGMGDTLIPLLSLVPMRVNLNNPGCLYQVQDDIIAVIPFENVPPGQVQKWVRSGTDLFNILFSVMHKDQTAYEIFDVVQSELPQPDFFLSMEIVVDIYLARNHHVLKTAASDAGVTLQCLGQAAWLKLVSSKVSSYDIMFGHIVSGCSFPGYEDIIGLMLNTIQCCVCIGETTTNRDLLCSIHANNLAASEWQHASLCDIQSETGLFDLWDSIFVFQPLKSIYSSPLWSLLNPDEFQANLQYPLNCEFHKMDDGFSVTPACLSNFMDLESLDHEMSWLEPFLATVVSQPNAKAIVDVLLDSRKLPLYSNVPTTSIAPHRGLNHLPPALVNVLVSIAKCSVDRLDLDSPAAAIGIDSITAIQLSTFGQPLQASEGIAPLRTTLSQPWTTFGRIGQVSRYFGSSLGTTDEH
ncbi:uncharacterized protein EDB93DRAFT_1252247 [Suillus bovinus]|uniref:uncharacterized protein n=1 Tax=Suillus bovinus TaxID=48563 RepID=UPI001B86C19F|nr:uncharacterized protein EDB93DRAFT_1252247 [Suillus bovinus]KAG2142777.1 hypothetical protein EDB93DRAFT_1252247 [Suillus bovinus]